MTVASPAHRCAVLPQSASMALRVYLSPASAYSREDTRRRRSLAADVFPPAHHCAVLPQPAGMKHADAYGCESLSRWRYRLTKVVIIPAPCTAICAQSATMEKTCAYGYERTRSSYETPRSRHCVNHTIPPCSVPPAHRIAVRAKTASLFITDAYGRQYIRRRRIQIIFVNPPVYRSAIRAKTVGRKIASAYGCEGFIRGRR